MTDPRIGGRLERMRHRGRALSRRYGHAVKPRKGMKLVAQDGSGPVWTVGKPRGISTNGKSWVIRNASGQERTLYENELSLVRVFGR